MYTKFELRQHILKQVVCCFALTLFTNLLLAEYLIAYDLTGKAGFANRQGQWLIYPQYDDVQPVSNGQAIVSIGGKNGIIHVPGSNVQIAPGSWKLPPTYESLISITPEILLAEESGKWGLITDTGHWILKPTYDAIYSIKGELIAVGMDDGKNTGAHKCGYIDLSGRIAIPLQYVYASQFSEGLASVTLKTGEEYSRAVINTSGTYVMEPRTDITHIKMFSEGLAAFKRNDKYGFMDTSGTIVLEPQFEDAEHFTEGLCPIKVNGKWGYIDQNGSIKIPAIYEYANPFNRGIARISLGKNKAGLITKDGNFFVNAVYGGVWRYGETSIFRFKTYDDRHGYFDENKQLLFQQPDYRNRTMKEDALRDMGGILREN